MTDLQSFLDEYLRTFVQTLQGFDRAPLDRVLRTLDTVAERGGTLWIAGNGGSAAISDHATCDTTKGTHVDGAPPVRSLSLVANTAMLTAIANDIEYAEVFARQLVYYLRDEDAVLLVSSSGYSPNVVRACEYANSRGVPTIAFVGFDGGRLRELATHCVWIPVRNYGMAEDAHQCLVHVLTQFVRQRTESAVRRRAAGSA